MRAGPFLTSVADTEPGPRVVSAWFPPSSMRFFFHFGKHRLMREQVDVLERRVYRRAATFLVCGAGELQQAAWRTLRGLPRHLLLGEGGHAEAKPAFLGWQGLGTSFCMKLKLTI